MFQGRVSSTNANSITDEENKRTKEKRSKNNREGKGERRRSKCLSSPGSETKDTACVTSIKLKTRLLTKSASFLSNDKQRSQT